VKTEDDSTYEVVLPYPEIHQYLKENKELSQKTCISTTKWIIKKGKFEEYDTMNGWMTAQLYSSKGRI
jgi:hypothetical protein